MGGPDRLWWVLIATALLLSPLFIGVKGIQQRKREIEEARRRAHGLAQRVSRALGLRLAEADEQFGAGAWMLSGMLHGSAVRITLYERAAQIEVSTEGAHPSPWELVSEDELAKRGGPTADPEDPFARVDAALLDGRLYVRGDDAEPALRAMTERARACVGTHQTVVDGWLRLRWAAAAKTHDERALAEELTRRVREVAEALEPDPDASPDESVIRDS